MFSTHCTNLKATVAGLSLTPTMVKVKIRKEEGCSYSQSQLEMPAWLGSASGAGTWLQLIRAVRESWFSPPSINNESCCNR